MDYRFPEQLFPTYFHSGPPNSVMKNNAGGWGEYQGVVNTSDQAVSSPAHWRFTPRHQTVGEDWMTSQPVVLPLLPPKAVPPWTISLSDNTNFVEHMENFYLDHYRDAFSAASRVLQENFNFGRRRRKGPETPAYMGWTPRFLAKLKHRKCEYSHLKRRVVSYDNLLGDVIHDIPPALLASMLQEELEDGRDRQAFSEVATGGALAYLPLSEVSPRGCLIYPASQGFHGLKFHKMALRFHGEATSCVDARSSKPAFVDLKGPVRQISCSSLLGDCSVCVRSDYLCGVWRFNETDKPRLLQVIKTSHPATCVSVSPHVLGEVLVADESGSAYLWVLGKGLQQVRHEESNLYFNASSPWRWCEFSAHPRVVAYGDRTGLELTDIRAREPSGYTLFRVGRTPECRSGERLVLARHLAHAHPFHHLVTTQYSAYIMDERFPCLPMLKWDHMMQSPPIFAHVLPGHASSSSVGGACSTTKVILGSQSSQELSLFQYSGGSVEPCVSVGPPLALLMPRDALTHLPVQIPHRHESQQRRLALPAAGLACVQGSGPDAICVLQLTEAGDVFYQVLKPPRAEQEVPPPGQEVDGSLRREEEEEEEGVSSPRPCQESRAEAPGWSSDEEAIGPTQGPPVVPETPERERPQSDSSSERSPAGNHGGSSRRLLRGLEVVVNEEEPAVVRGDGDAERPAEDGQTPGAPADPAVPLSEAAAAAWKVWLQKLQKKEGDARAKRPARFCVEAERFELAGEEERPEEEEERPEEEEERPEEGLRRALREGAASGALLLLHGATLLPPAETPELPGAPLPEDWPDKLSQRLAASWRGGEEAWRLWWADELGLNVKERAAALRRRRRREKEARRSRRSLDLSGSFVSSGGGGGASSYVDLETASVWSSAASQRGWSDTDEDGGGASRPPPDWSVTGSPRSSRSRASWAAAPRKRKVPLGQLTPSSTGLPSLSQTPRTNTCRSPSLPGVAGSVVDPKERTPQRGFFEDEESFEPLFFSTQRSARAHLSQPLSQSLSQSSQPKKKRSQMGF